MDLLVKGMLLGLTLSVLVGPMLFVLIQLGIEQGFRAGMMAGLGAWMSDCLFIVCIYFGLSYILKLTQWEGFSLWVGLAGGFILILFGIGALVHRPARKIKKVSFRNSYLGFWLKGFLINTFNPFAAFFWLGVISTLPVEARFEVGAVTIYFGGIIGMVILTDLLKVLLAKKVREWLKHSYILLIQRISGFALVILGLVMIVRVCFL